MNITDEGRRKGQETARLRREATPDVGIKSPIEANAEFARRIGDKCFCNAVCKCGKRKK